MSAIIPNAIENLDLRPSQSPGIGRSNLAPIPNSGDDSIAPIAGAFASVLNPIFSRVGYNERYPHLRQFEATHEGFQCAFNLKGRHISKCVFIDQRLFPPMIYNPLEFAVKADDVVSARKLFNFNMGFQSPLCNETILHFYIDCVGDKEPNPEMLSLVLKQCNIPWVWKSKIFSHPVEKALQKVIGIKKLNEPLLKALLPFGVRFTKNGLSIPFLALKNSYIRNRDSEDPFRSERLFLHQISTYTALEKSFHPHSKAGLTSSEFRDLTPFFRKEIVKRAIPLVNQETV